MPPIATPEADARPRAAGVPVPRPPADEAVAPAPPVDAAVGALVHRTSPRGTEQGAPSARRVPLPPGRRAPLWFAALVVGALLAAAPGFAGDDATVTVDASHYGLGADVGISGADDAGARRGITEAEARARLDELAASRAAREPTTVLPLSGVLTTCYCDRWGQMHFGLDIAAPLGTPIYSAADGVVIEAGPVNGFGNAVYIQDEDGNVHIYGHMRYYSVQAGQLVRAGDQIATVGDEGFSTGPHLHYEIHRHGRDGAPLDPQAWLAARGVSV